MSMFDKVKSIFGTHGGQVCCEGCNKPVAVAGRVKRPFFCDNCRVTERAQQEIYLMMGRQTELSPIPTLRGNVRPKHPHEPWQEMAENEPGSECLYCGTRMFRLDLISMKGCFAKTEGETLMVPAGPQTEMDLVECPNPACEQGWNAVRGGSRSEMSGLPPELVPPWGQGDAEYHERWWANRQALRHTTAGKGVKMVGMFGAPTGALGRTD